MTRKIRLWFRWLTRFANRPWYLPVISFLAAADAYVVFVPIEVILLPAVLMAPRRWIRTAIWVSIGSAVGSASFSYLTELYGEVFINWIFPHLTKSKDWQHFQRIIQDHGGIGLALVSFSPFPQHAAVALAGLAKIPVNTVFWAITIGRLPKYLLVAWCALHAPRILRKLGINLER